MMKRRDFLKRTTVGASAILAAPAVLSAESLNDDRPNVLFIMTDQQSATMMSCTGNSELKTPNLDRLATSGVRFERCYATNPVCVPSRFSLQTGCMPSAIGMTKNQSSLDVPDAMADSSLGPIMRRAGYDCAYGGKVHVPKKLQQAMFRDGYRNLTGDARDALSEEAARYVAGPHEKPFFLFASFINPHDICYMAINDHARVNGKPPMGNLDSRICESFLDEARSSDDLHAFVEEHCPELPDNFEIPTGEPECVTRHYTDERPFRRYVRDHWTDDMWRLHRWLYCRLTERVDEQIGRVLDALYKTRRNDDTLIIFTSDHGDHDSAHRLEHKSLPYEESARVPMLMAHRGRIAPDRVDDTYFVSNGLDLLPTLCDYAGCERPTGLSGASLRPIAEDRLPKDWRDFVAVESQNARMIRTDRFKYCVYDCGENRESLVDLVDDPGEMQNLADRPEYRDVLESHRRRLAAWTKTVKDDIGAAYLIAPVGHGSDSA